MKSPRQPAPARRPTPCPFCGRAVPKRQSRCPQCRMPLDRQSVAALERLMGPWFVLDEAHPSAPGVSWGKLLSLIERGKVGPESVVRGPATGGLWRRARRTPSVATRLGLCWACQSPLPPDRKATRCPNCRAELNGPLNWPEPQAGPAPPDEQPAPDAIEELIGAAVPGAPGRARPDAAPRRRRRSRWAGAMAALLLTAAVCGGIIYGLAEMIGSRAQGPGPEAAAERDRRRTRAQTEADPPPAVRPLPAGAAPGELFPEVPEYRDPPSASRPEKPEARAEPPSRPATLPVATQTRPADIDRQERSAKALLEMAKALRDEGKLMEAQQVLVKMLNTHDRRAWPKEAVAALAEIQDPIRRADDAPGQPSPEELARQKRSAEKLFARARELIARDNILAAQEPLLEILNTHHPKAWPAGTLEAFKSIQQTLSRTPATAPTFFNVNPPP